MDTLYHVRRPSGLAVTTPIAPLSEPLQLVLARLEDARPTGTGHIARCPAHKDANPSLSVAEGTDGRVLLKCHAGCDFDSIVSALGLDKRDLFAAPAIAKGPAGRKTEQRWPIEDHTGTLRAIHCRFDPPGEKKVVYWRRPDGQKGLGEIKVESLPLYGSDRLTERPGAPVIVVEGEKAADALRPVAESLGCVVLGTVTGASTIPRDEVLAVLTGRRVYTWADSDAPGEHHMMRITARLAALGVEVHRLHWPGAMNLGDDAADFIATGNGPADLRALIDAARPGEHVTGAEAAEPVPTEADWEPPAALQSAALPPFPVEAFPSRLATFVRAEATATQTPVDLASMVVLGVTAATVAGKVRICVRDGWLEPLCLYVVPVAAPGERKSAVVADAKEPVEDFEAALVERLAPQIAEAEERTKIVQGRLQTVRAQAVKAQSVHERESLTQEVIQLTRELSAAAPVAQPRLLADDATPERVVGLLRENGGRIAIVTAEADILDLLSGRYGNAPNFGVFLRGHAGDPLRVDRVGRPSEIVKAPAITLVATVQPSVLEGLEQTPGLRGRGLLARILYSLPTSLLGRRQVASPPVPAVVRQGYHDTISALLALEPGVDDRGNSVPHVLRLTAEAEQEFLAFERWIEPQLAEHGAMGTFNDWSGKLAGAVARIAGILHLAAHADDSAPWLAPVSATTIESAARIGRYLVEHARAAFAAMGASADVVAAQRVLRWIKHERVASFTRRSAFNALRGAFKKVDDIDPALALLEAHGYVRRRAPEERSSRGRKPSPEFDVNPYALAPESAAAGNSAYSAYSAHENPISEDM